MEKKRVGVYVRVSIENGQDTAMQEAELIAYAERRGWEPKVYRDSGSKWSEGKPPRTGCLRWREMVGPEFSPFVFPNLRIPGIKDVRHAWAKALKDTGIEYFWIYNLRHTFASRLSAAGVSDLFVAQMIGHSTPSILQKYSKAIDEYRRDAVRKLENMRAEHTLRDPIQPSIN